MTIEIKLGRQEFVGETATMASGDRRLAFWDAALYPVAGPDGLGGMPYSEYDHLPPLIALRFTTRASLAQLHAALGELLDEWPEETNVVL